MSIEGGRVESSDKRLPMMDLADVAAGLQEESFEGGLNAVPQSPRIYNLARTTKPTDLETLGELPFENSMYEIDDKLILATGGKNTSLPDYAEHRAHMLIKTNWETANSALIDVIEQNIAQRRTSRFVLHSHPGTTLEGLMGSDLAVSDGDMKLGEEYNGEIFFVLTNKGIVGYQQQSPTLHLGLAAQIVIGSQTGVTALENPNRILEKQREKGITRFFVAFRGDDEAQRKLELICQYINDPSIKWDSIKGAIED